jgi:hypothetical protein
VNVSKKTEISSKTSTTALAYRCSSRGGGTYWTKYGVNIIIFLRIFDYVRGFKHKTGRKITSLYTGCFLKRLDACTALRFTGTGEPLVYYISTQIKLANKFWRRSLSTQFQLNLRKKFRTSTVQRGYLSIMRSLWTNNG